MKNILFALLGLTLFAPSFAQAQTPECEMLWYERNKIFAEGGLCYRSTLGRALFGDLECSLQRGGDVFLTTEQGQQITEIRRQEQALNCKIQTGRPPSEAFLSLLKNKQPEAIEQAPQTAFVGETASWRTCDPHGDIILVWDTPKQENLVGTIPSNTPLTQAPQDDNWYPVTLTVEGWNPTPGWIERSYVANACEDPRNTQTMSIYAPHNNTKTIEEAVKKPGIIPLEEKGATEYANTLWTTFSWTSLNCGPTPNTEFTLESIAQFRKDIISFKNCIRQQEQKDEIDFTIISTQIGAEILAVPGMEHQTVFPWDCLTCQGHYQSFQVMKEQRDHWRENALAQIRATEEAVKTWMLNRP